MSSLSSPLRCLVPQIRYIQPVETSHRRCPIGFLTGVLGHGYSNPRPGQFLDQFGTSTTQWLPRKLSSDKYEAIFKRNLHVNLHGSPPGSFPAILAVPEGNPMSV